MKFDNVKFKWRHEVQMWQAGAGQWQMQSGAWVCQRAYEKEWEAQADVESIAKLLPDCKLRVVSTPEKVGDDAPQSE